MLARDRITIILDGRRYVLRPTLQAAIRLEGSIGLTKALASIFEGGLTTMCAVIRETADANDELSTILDGFMAPTLALNMTAARDPLARLIMAMLGIDPDAEHEPAEAPVKSAPPVAEQLAQLYRQATGWLGWTPKVALDATPTEIMEAVTGRADMLSAIFGGGKRAEPEVDLDAKFRAVFSGLAKRKAA